MPKFLSNGQVFDLVDEEVANLCLPEGFETISDERAAELLATNISPPTPEAVRKTRDSLIAAVQWRYERNARETRLSLKPTDSIAVLDKYVQDLADVTKQKGFPEKVKWPINPFEEK